MTSHKRSRRSTSWSGFANPAQILAAGVRQATANRSGRAPSGISGKRSTATMIKEEAMSLIEVLVALFVLMVVLVPAATTPYRLLPASPASCYLCHRNNC